MSQKLPDDDLLLEMRKATRKSHHIANALILSKLVVVLTDQQLYAAALSSFLPVYSRLEELLHQHKNVPRLAQVVEVVGQIPRKQAMELDLAHFLGPEWRSKLPASAAAQAYADHLTELAASNPVLLLPYAFSLYIPILLGFMAQRIQRALQLPADKEGSIPGLAFFTVPDKPARLAELRSAVKAAGQGMAPTVRHAVVAEAVEQFRRNNAVVAEFSVGWRATLHALQLAAAAVPAWAVAGAAAAGAAGLCVAAGVWPQQGLAAGQ